MPEKRNITIQLDEHAIKKAKVLALHRGTSVSALVAQKIEELTAADERYEAARERALSALDEASSRGGRSWQREELYDRDVLR